MAREITVIGGGTGSFNLLSGLRTHQGLSLRSIVTMMDSGGDSGQLRDAFGVLPPGDLRRCLVALSEESQILRDLFSFRFEEGALEGRNFGNLFFLALTRALGSEKEAVSALGRILKIRGEVIPVTWDHAQLVARTSDGHLLRGEAAIDRRAPCADSPRPAPIEAIWLEPQARANPAALEAIRNSDAVVLAPGDVFTSLVPNLLVAGVSEAIRASRGRLVVVVNLMTKSGETDGWGAQRHVDELARRAGRAPDAVLVHAGAFAAERLRDYAREGATPVADDLPGENAPFELARADLASAGALIHHDPHATARALIELLLRPAALRRSA